MTKLAWLHLSDLHLRGDETAVDRHQFTRMLDDIHQNLVTRQLQLDAVFFTGDIAHAGQEYQYQMAIDWFDDVLRACNLEGQRNKMFLVPGNHDINRDAVKKPTYLLPQYEAFAKGLLDPEQPYQHVNEFLGDNDHKKWAFDKFKNFARFVENFFRTADIRFDHDNYYFFRSLQKSRHVVVVIGLNSAWLSFRDDEQGQLLLGERQVCEALERSRREWPNARLHIALLHHPLYWLAEKDLQKVQPHLSKQFGLLLRGHLHCPSYSVQSNPDSHIHTFAAGASLKANYHAYNLVELDLDSGRGKAIVRLQHPEIGGNWGADCFTYSNAVNGEISFDLSLNQVQ